MGKEVIKIFGISTWEIVDTSDIYEGSRHEHLLLVQGEM